MPKYTVIVKQTSQRFAYVEVVAKTAQQARTVVESMDEHDLPWGYDASNDLTIEKVDKC